MRLVFDSSRRSGGPGAMCALGLVSLCTLILCGFALGRTPPPSASNAAPKPEAQTPTKAKPGPSPKPKRSAVRSPKARPMGKANQKGARRPSAIPRKGVPSFEMDPNAKLVCENPTVTLDPVWRNGKDLTFRFNIRNDGTADLRIKAKGG